MITVPDDTRSSKKTAGSARLLATDAAKQIAIVVAAGLVLLSILWRKRPHRHIKDIGDLKPLRYINILML